MKKGFILEEEYTGAYKSTFKEVDVLHSTEDVATLLEVFRSVLGTYSSDYISRVVEDDSGHYLFLINGKYLNEFDLYEFINARYSGGVVVNCVNALLLFPESKSRGLYNDVYLAVEEEEDEYENEATGYIDEEDISDILRGNVLNVVYNKSGVVIPITSEGVIIGRSSKYSDFILKSNVNVSRKHCKLYKKNGVYMVEDLNSNNGTYVNGLRVREKPLEVGSGDTLLIADEVFTFK